MAQPIPIDMNGDLKIDLFGNAPGSVSQFKVWDNAWNSSQRNSPIFDLCVMTSLHCLIAILTLLPFDVIVLILPLMETIAQSQIRIAMPP